MNSENRVGYEHWKTKVFVDKEDAYDYALEQCLHGEEHEEFKEMLVEWYYSGDWIERG